MLVKQFLTGTLLCVGGLLTGQAFFFALGAIWAAVAFIVFMVQGLKL